MERNADGERFERPDDGVGGVDEGIGRADGGNRRVDEGIGRADEGVGRSPRAVLRTLWRRDRLLAAVAAVQAALLAAFVVGVAVDPRTVGGEPVWLKPAKFALSLAVLAGTLAWLGPHLPASRRRRRVVSAAVGGGALVEIALIGGQAARGVESHFNVGTPLDGAVYGLMGVVVVGMTLSVAWLLAGARSRDPAAPVAPAFATGIRLGLLLFVVGSFQGGTMVGLSASGVGGPPTVPVLGWTLLGDFRVAHFVGLHSLQALPLVGYLAARRAGRGRLADPVRVVRLAALAYALVLAGALAVAVAPLVA